MIGIDEYGREVYTPDNQPALTIRSTDAGVKNQVSGITFTVTDRSGHMRNEVNAVLDDFKEVVRAQNPSKDNALILQTGTKANQAVKVSFTDMRSVALGLQSYDGLGWGHGTLPAGIAVVGGGPKIQVTTREAANAAINVFQNALIKATDQAIAIGAAQNRLGYTSSNLVTASENVQASESVIRDSDMAKEMTAYTKHNVLTQSAQAMLAQANQNSSAVLTYHPPIVLGRLEGLVVFTPCLCYYQMTCAIRYTIQGTMGLSGRSGHEEQSDTRTITAYMLCPHRRDGRRFFDAADCPCCANGRNCCRRQRTSNH